MFELILIADAAHNPHTIFQAIHDTLVRKAGSRALVLQIHGFEKRRHLGYPDAVLGGGPPCASNLTNLLSSLSKTLADQGITAGLCDNSSWTDLCGETNVQSNSQSTGLFIHLEIDETLRSTPAKLLSVQVEALGD